MCLCVSVSFYFGPLAFYMQMSHSSPTPTRPSLLPTADGSLGTEARGLETGDMPESLKRGGVFYNSVISPSPILPGTTTIWSQGNLLLVGIQGIPLSESQWMCGWSIARKHRNSLVLDSHPRGWVCVCVGGGCLDLGKGLFPSSLLRRTLDSWDLNREQGTDSWLGSQGPSELHQSRNLEKVPAWGSGRGQPGIVWEGTRVLANVRKFLEFNPLSPS